MKTQTQFFVCSLLMSTMLATSSSNMLFVWLMMELNTLSFIPIIMITHNITETETSIKYLIPQTLGSNLFLMSSFLAYTMVPSKPVTSIALLLKMGSAPAHMWFPPVMSSINLMAGFTMLTWQKVMPLSLLTAHELTYSPVIITSAMISALWGSIAGLNQTNLMTLLSFSSINHSGWMLMSLTLELTINYLTAYTLTLIPIYFFAQMHMTKTHSSFMTSLTSNNNYQMLLTLTLLSISGMPPMAMFMVKLPIMMEIVTKSLTATIIPLILGTMISLYFYLSLTLTLLITLKISPQQPSTSTFLLKTTYMLLLLSQILWLPLKAIH